MAGDSLILGDAIELLQGGVVSAIPACAGAVFLLTPGYDLSAPQPSQAQVATLILDGSRPSGRRSENRSITLTVKITVPGQSGTTARATLAAAREVLARIADQPAFHLTWTLDGSSLPLVLDCFRATAAPGYDPVMDAQAVSLVTFTCEALPFGRSDVPSVVDFPSPVAGGSAPASPVTVDNYSTVTGSGWTQSALGPGPNSAFWTAGGLRGTASYTRAGIGPFSLTGLAGLTVWAGFGAPAGLFPYFGLRRGGPVTFSFTVSDGTHSATRHVVRRIVLSNNSLGGPVWQKIRIPMPKGATVNFAAITGYTITVSNEQPGSLAYTDLYLDSLTAVPVPVGAPVTPATGVVYDLAGIDGSARSAMSLQVQQPQGVTQQLTKLFTTVGPVSWLAPAECTVMQAAGALGPGGKGSKSTSSGAYAGAPGGEGSWEFGIPVTPGTVYSGNISRGGQSSSGAAGDTTMTFGALTITGHGASNRSDGVTGALAGTGTATYSPAEKMTGDPGNFDATIANWTGVTNATVARTTTNPRSGAGALRVTSVAAGDMIAASCLAANILTQGVGTWGLSTVPLAGFARAVTTGRSFQLGAEFYDVSGVSLGQLFGSSASDVTTGYTAGGATSLTAPGGSRWLRYLVKVLATGGAAEGHSFDDLSARTGQSQPGGTGAAATSGNTIPGGGGGVGGNTGAGSNGSGLAGGAAGSGSPASGKGGKGQASFGTGGTGGTPGGGGAGANAGIVAQVLNGGIGGDGGISLTFQQRAAMKTLVLHRPGFDALDTLCPFVSIPPTDTPDGTTEYPVPSLLPGSSARFGAPATASTFTIYAVSSGWHSPGSSRQVTVTVNQYEQNGGSVYPSTIQRTVTPNADLAFQGTSTASPLCKLGELTLPATAMPDDNVSAYFTITITSTDPVDSFQEVLFLDTMGSTVIIESPVAYVTYWVDEPTADVEIGNVMASQFDRNDAVSVLAYTTLSGPPLHMDPLGCQSLLVYTADAGLLAPAAQATYWPRWLNDRLS